MKKESFFAFCYHTNSKNSYYLQSWGGDINSVWETIIQNIKVSAKESLGYYELKEHKPWFDEGCSKLLDQSNEAKLQWL
jgi:hypothetical protein